MPVHSIAMKINKIKIHDVCSMKLSYSWQLKDTNKFLVFLVQNTVLYVSEFELQLELYTCPWTMEHELAS